MASIPAEAHRVAGEKLPITLLPYYPMTPSPSSRDRLGLIQLRVVCIRGQLTWNRRRDFHPALANRKKNGANPIGRVQLAQHRCHVVLDRLLGDEELVGDLLVGESL